MHAWNLTLYAQSNLAIIFPNIYSNKWWGVRVPNWSTASIFLGLEMIKKNFRTDDFIRNLYSECFVQVRSNKKLLWLFPQWIVSDTLENWAYYYQAFSTHLFTVVTTCQKLFNQAVKNNEQVATSHFLDTEFWLSSFPVYPGIGYPSIGIMTHNGLERKFYR